MNSNNFIVPPEANKEEGSRSLRTAVKKRNQDGKNTIKKGVASVSFIITFHTIDIHYWRTSCPFVKKKEKLKETGVEERIYIYM
ncbi:unnamed protein product [Rhizophagus irregularis]|nr:unnamed protein product [Rhizophagus irregularis]